MEIKSGRNEVFLRPQFGKALFRLTERHAQFGLKSNLGFFFKKFILVSGLTFSTFFIFRTSPSVPPIPPKRQGSHLSTSSASSVTAAETVTNDQVLFLFLRVRNYFLNDPALWSNSVLIFLHYYQS
jgi:hypothetical protein